MGLERCVVVKGVGRKVEAGRSLPWEGRAPPGCERSASLAVTQLHGSSLSLRLPVTFSSHSSGDGSNVQRRGKAEEHSLPGAGAC